MTSPTPARPSAYPLAAVAAQPQLLLALSLLAVAPGIGGLLIRGGQGAAKSTAARGLGELLPTGGPFVNLPLGATEDRVVGTLDIQAALRGTVTLQPGLMAQAHGGLLYIDEVNLLPDHLVDVLLDAAAMGTVRVQRDNLSAESAARFALVGSMNPEEGQLRPQFLDRFGLCVDVYAPLDPTQRREILRRRMAFEQDPQGFWATWQPQQERLRQQLSAAYALLPSVQVTDGALDEISQQVSSAGVRSLRADLVLYRAARAHAALEGRTQADQSDVEAVAPMVLLHRQERQGGQDQQRAAPPSSPPPQEPPPSIQPPSTQPPAQQPSPDPDPDQNLPQPQPPTGSAAETVAAPAAAQALGTLPAPQREGRQVGSRPDPQTTRLDWPATLRSAALTCAPPTAHNLHAPIHEPARGVHTLFLVDSSGSLGLAGKISVVKGAMLATLAQAGAADRVALGVFRGSGAKLLLDWTKDTAAIEATIQALPTGGRTPLAHGLELAAQYLQGVRGARLVLFTDGRANVPLHPGTEAWADALSAAKLLTRYPVQVVDTETGHVRLGRATKLAQVMNAAVRALDTLTP